MMKANFLLFGLSIFLTMTLSGVAFGADEGRCTPVDMREALGPNRDQGNMGWCYANTTADLLSYRFRNELKGQPVSSGYIALAFNHTYFQEPNSEGGNVWLASYMAQREGVCLQDVEEKIMHTGPRFKLKQKLSALLYLKQNFDRTYGQSLDSDLKKYYGSYDSTLLAMPRGDLRHLFVSSTEQNIAKNFADYMCRGQRFYPHNVTSTYVDSRWFYLGSTQPLLLQIHHQLDQANIIGINYYADFFDKDNAPKTPDGRHASSIVGRRWNKDKKTCELLIRNSWGTRCTGYKAASLKEPGVCDKGNIWVSEKVLGQYLTSIVWLKK
ncbi:MAG: hypothetical protein ACM3MG_11175 [Bacillota bacterium]